MVEESKTNGVANGKIVPADNNQKITFDLESHAVDEERNTNAQVCDIEQREEAELPHETKVDPWGLPELLDDSLPWKDLSLKHKILRVCCAVGKAFILLALLYFFVCSLDFLTSALRLLVGKRASELLSDVELLKNPVVGLMLGVLGTVFVQSSSTSTSIVITMVGANLITVKNAIPIIMGANIGTSVTNTFVSYGQAMDRELFRRAFAAATVHDMFNWLTVFILLPFEVATGYLEYISGSIVRSAGWEKNDQLNKAFLKVITKPFTSLIVQLNSKVLEDIASNNATPSNATLLKECKGTCGYLMEYFALGDFWSGLLLFVIAIVLLIGCLILIVKLLQSVLKGRFASIIKMTVNSEPRFPFNYLVGYFAICVGCGITILVQSSSIFTSTLTPLAGLGVISLDRMYPLTLGSNIGTTTTGILAAFAADPKRLKYTLQIAFCHLFFNLTGIILFFPVPFMRFPIPLAKILGNTSAKYRWVSILYLLVMFLLLPAFVFGLSLAGPVAFMAIGIPLLCLFFAVVILNILQSKCPRFLPVGLRNWNWLPECMHSLNPLDRLIGKLCQHCSCCRGTGNAHDGKSFESCHNRSQVHIMDSAPPEITEIHTYENPAFSCSQNGERSTSTKL